MDFTNQFILLSGLLLALSVLAGLLSRRTGAPLILSFLAVGVLFGQDGPGGIVFNDMELSFFACSVALAIILFDGGIQTPIASFKRAARPAGLLATAGVIITAGLVALCIHFGLDLPFLNALLIGSVVASTDAAAVFLLLRQHGLRLKPHLASVLEVESGINDPMAVLLTLTLVELIIHGFSEQSGWLIAVEFTLQLGLGIGLGMIGGKLLTYFFSWVETDSGLYPIFALASGMLIFGASNVLGGSGFLAAYIAGLMLGNHEYKAKRVVQQFMDGMAWLSQLAMLLILGLLVTPSELIHDVPRGLVIALALIFIGRPVAVFCCLLFEKMRLREKLFISWVGLRGGIPIYLAIIPVLAGMDVSYFNLAFIVVVCSLLLQGWTIRFMARRLGVMEPPTD